MATYNGADKRLAYLFQNGGGGGGSTVSITPTLQSGTKIADYEIDGDVGELYAPAGGGSANIWTGTQAEYEAQASQIADGTQVNITDDEENVRALDIYPTDDKPIVIGKYGSEDVKRIRITKTGLATGGNTITIPKMSKLIDSRGYCKENRTSNRVMTINSIVGAATNWYCSLLLPLNSTSGSLWIGSEFNGGSCEIWLDYVEASS